MITEIVQMVFQWLGFNMMFLMIYGIIWTVKPSVTTKYSKIEFENRYLQELADFWTHLMTAFSWVLFFPVMITTHGIDKHMKYYLNENGDTG